MSLQQDLIQQAIHLSRLEASGPPKQASLRRAVSAAYYALFHQLTLTGAHVCAPSQPTPLRARVRRAFQHSHMKQFCSTVKPGTHPAPAIRALLAPATGFSPALVQIAQSFVDLQDARHRADYDSTYRHTRAYTDQQIRRAQRALLQWTAVKTSSEAKVFVAALLFADRWNK